MVKFYENAITPGCLDALGYLHNLKFVHDFYLAGGTALALQIGHRVSTDLDWFSSICHLSQAERNEIQETLSGSKEFEVASEQDGMMYTQLFGTDVSFIYQHHPLLEHPIEYRGFQIASPTDIGLMKLSAINSRGTRRDFIDLYCLRSSITLDRLLELAPRKYSDRPSFLAISLRALTYFDDAEQQPMPQMLSTVQWNEVRSYCEEAARILGRRLSGLD